MHFSTPATIDSKEQAPGSTLRFAKRSMAGRRLFEGNGVLAIFERYFRLIQGARSDSDLLEIVRSVGHDFGFRSGFLVEYGDPVGTKWRAIDTEGNESWWTEYFASAAAIDNPRVGRILGSTEVIHFDPCRFGPDESGTRELAQRGDMLDATMVPLALDGKVVGAMGLRGTVDLTPTQQSGLQFIAYNLFAQFRALHGEAIVAGRAALTRREREVIRLSAEGMTSLQIAAQLGMSARTANQHFDNVADKLGTRNRAHTVAEVIRRGLLD